MRAERDEYEYRKPPRAREPRLAYEIALGIIIAGVVLWVLEAIASYIAARIMLEQLQFYFR